MDEMVPSHRFDYDETLCAKDEEDFSVELETEFTL